MHEQFSVPESSSWLGDVAWPAVAVIALVALIFSRRLHRMLARVVRRTTKVKGGPLEFEFSADVAKDVRASIGQDLADFKLAAEGEYDRQVRAHDLDERLRLAVEVVLKAIDVPAKECRGTVHVPDVVFDGCLYQLLNYHCGKSGRGRRWSERYGLLGRAWRLRTTMYADHALGDAQPMPPEDQALNELIATWGMTRTEAERAVSVGARQSFLCIMLRVKNRAVGVLYLDARERNVFRSAADAAGKRFLQADNALETLPLVAELAKSVDKAMKPLRASGTYLAFYRDPDGGAE